VLGGSSVISHALYLGVSKFIALCAAYSLRFVSLSLLCTETNNPVRITTVKSSNTVSIPLQFLRKNILLIFKSFEPVVVVLLSQSSILQYNGIWLYFTLEISPWYLADLKPTANRIRGYMHINESLRAIKESWSDVRR